MLNGAGATTRVAPQRAPGAWAATRAAAEGRPQAREDGKGGTGRQTVLNAATWRDDDWTTCCHLLLAGASPCCFIRHNAISFARLAETFFVVRRAELRVYFCLPSATRCIRLKLDRRRTDEHRRRVVIDYGGR